MLVIAVAFTEEISLPMLGWARLPDGVSWKVLSGAGCLAGLGFPMSFFIAGLALEGGLLEAGKIGTLAGSALSAITGCGCCGGSSRRSALPKQTVLLKMNIEFYKEMSAREVEAVDRLKTVLGARRGRVAAAMARGDDGIVAVL